MAFQSAINIGPLEGNPNCMAVGDFNEDGNPDLAVTSEGTSKVFVLQGDLAVVCLNDTRLFVFIGDGNGDFQAKDPVSLGDNIRDMASGDFNNDGNPLTSTVSR
jgi:hypothetical protein